MQLDVDVAASPGKLSITGNTSYPTLDTNFIYYRMFTAPVLRTWLFASLIANIRHIQQPISFHQPLMLSLSA
jgi:hypothetical protein